jgi:hypothetical protein
MTVRGHIGGMTKPHQKDELAMLRDLQKRLETGTLTMRRNREDVTQQEIGILKREIAHFETILARLKGAS